MVEKPEMAKFGTPPAHGSGPVLVPGSPRTSDPYLTLVWVGKSNWWGRVVPNVESMTNVGLATYVADPEWPRWGRSGGNWQRRQTRARRNRRESDHTSERTGCSMAACHNGRKRAASRWRCNQPWYRFCEDCKPRASSGRCC